MPKARRIGSRDWLRLTVGALLVVGIAIGGWLAFRNLVAAGLVSLAFAGWLFSRAPMRRTLSRVGQRRYHRSGDALSSGSYFVE